MLRLGSCPVAVLIFILLVHLADTKYQPAVQKPIQVPQTPATNKSISVELFRDLEELSRIVDIAYCVGAVGPGIQNPFCCPSHCQDFKHFELVTVRIRTMGAGNRQTT